MKTPNITRKQAEEAVRKYGFKICKEKGYSKKEVKKADRFEKKHGFRYEDVWNLDNSIACFVLPRLVQLRDVHMGYPNSMLENPDDNMDETLSKKADKKWNKILNKMIYAYYLYVTKDEYELTEEEKEKQAEGFELYSHFFSALWD